jgi:hypothetical protein
MRVSVLLFISLFVLGCTSTDWQTYKIFNSDDPSGSAFGAYTNVSYEGVQVTENIKKLIVSNQFVNSCDNEKVDNRFLLIDKFDFHKKIQSAEIIHKYSEAKYDLMEDDENALPVMAVESVNPLTNENFVIGNLKISTLEQGYCLADLVENICAAQTGSLCVTTHYLDISRTESQLAEVRAYAKARQEEYLAYAKDEREMKEKREALEFLRLQEKCEEFGFEGDKNIRLCIEREAEFERQIALQKLAYAQQNNIVEEEKEMGLLAQILRDVIVAYPETKAKADREAAIRRKSYIDGQRAEQARCSGGRC